MVESVGDRRTTIATSVAVSVKSWFGKRKDGGNPDSATASDKGEGVVLCMYSLALCSRKEWYDVTLPVDAENVNVTVTCPPVSPE